MIDHLRKLGAREHENLLRPWSLANSTTAVISNHSASTNERQLKDNAMQIAAACVVMQGLSW